MEDDTGIKNSSVSAPLEIFPDPEDFLATSMDVVSWFTSDLSATGSYDIGILAATSFGKLLDVLPVPTLLIDDEFKIVFANAACGNVSQNYKVLLGVPFASLIPKPKNAEKALRFIKRVYWERRSVVAEAILEIDARKIWGKLYFRSVRMGNERYILLLIENLTDEKTQLVLRDKNDQKQRIQTIQLAHVLKDRTRRLQQTSEQLCEQVLKNELTESQSRLEEERYNALAERAGIATAIVTREGHLTRSNKLFNEFFGLVSGDMETESNNQVCLKKIIEWCNQTSSIESQSEFSLENNPLSKVICDAVKLSNGDHLIICDNNNQIKEA